MRPQAVPSSSSNSRRLDAEVSRLLCEGGDDRIVVRADGLNAYGCAPEPWFGSPTFSSTTASPISPDAFDAAGVQLADWSLAQRPGHAAQVAADEIRARLLAHCGLAASDGTELALAPSGTDLHRIAAAIARQAARGPFVAVMPAQAETGRGVARAVLGQPSGPLDQPSALVMFPLRAETGQRRPLADIDADCEAACRRALRAGGSVLLVLLEVSKTGIAAPSPSVAAQLKAEFGDRVTVLVDACQFRLPASALRRHLANGFLVAVTGSKFLGGPAFSGALFLPRQVAGGMANTSFDWSGLGGSTREDWPEVFTGRMVLPSALSLGPALRWAAALYEADALSMVDARSTAAAVEGFRSSLDMILEDSSAVEALDPASMTAAAALGDSQTIFPLILKRGGVPLSVEATDEVYLRMRELAQARRAGQLWIGQPVLVGRQGGAAISAVRLSLSARHLSAFAGLKDGVGRLAVLAEEAVSTLGRLAERA